jgi:hypothetical protein
MLSHVWSSAGYEQWKAMLISIENLLEDKQGFSMGEMFRDLDSSCSGHSHFSDWQDHSVPPGFDPQDNVSMGTTRDMSTSSVHYDGSVLMVNFRQLRLLVIHWFRLWFGTNPPLGILMMLQVHTCTTILEVVVYARNLRWRRDFRDKFTKHFGRRSWSPTRVKTRDEHDSKWPEDRSVNVQVFWYSNRKQQSLYSKDSSLNREGNDVKGPHASAHK